MSKKTKELKKEFVEILRKRKRLLENEDKSLDLYCAKHRRNAKIELLEELIEELKEELFREPQRKDLFREPQRKDLHPILDHYNAEINRKLGKELFEL